MKHTKQEIQDARESLLRLLKPGDKVFTSLEHVSRSGLQRVIQLHVFRGSNRNPQHRVLGWNATKVLNDRYHERHEGVVVNGCGMDMGFDLVYRLSYALFAKTPQDRKAAYALTHEWI